jgi:hypothetical protein
MSWSSGVLIVVRGLEDEIDEPDVLLRSIQGCECVMRLMRHAGGFELLLLKINNGDGCDDHCGFCFYVRKLRDMLK